MAAIFKISVLYLKVNYVFFSENSILNTSVPKNYTFQYIFAIFYWVLPGHLKNAKKKPVFPYYRSVT